MTIRSQQGDDTIRERSGRTRLIVTQSDTDELLALTV
jgi:hypothetical protein